MYEKMLSNDENLFGRVHTTETENSEGDYIMYKNENKLSQQKHILDNHEGRIGVLEQIT